MQQPPNFIVSQIKYEYVGFSLRAFALLIDVFICSLILSSLVGIFASIIEALGGSLGGSFIENLIVILYYLLFWLYFALLESSKWQATLGKKILGLKVINKNQGRISFSRASVRYWVKILLYPAIIMVAFTKKKQGLHDKIVGTFVIKELT